MLNLNEIERSREVATSPNWWGERDSRKAIAKLLEQIPALVKELRGARATIDHLQVRIAALGTQVVEYDEWKEETNAQAQSE